MIKITVYFLTDTFDIKLIFKRHNIKSWLLKVFISQGEERIST